MKAFAITGLLEMKLIEVPTPSIQKDNEVMVGIKSVGVCGSDVHYYRTGRIGEQVVEYPYIVGHECSGIIEKCGKSVNQVKVGDRVAIDPAITCGECDQCLTGRSNTCRKLRFLACPGQADGSLAEYIVLPEKCCFPIQESTTFELATLSEPLSIGVYAVKNAILMDEPKVGILGAGPIGLCIQMVVLEKGAKRVYITDKIDERLYYAKQHGAYWTGNPQKENIVDSIMALETNQLDVVFECCGQQEAMDEAIQLLKPGGKLVIVGIPEFDNWILSADLLRRKEITIQNIRRQEGCVQEALDMIENKQIPIDNLITHRFNFKNTKETFDLVEGYNDGVLKAIINL